MQEETNFHLFWQCWYIQDLWSNVQEILTSNNIEIQLSYFNISFGVNCKNKPKNLVFNFIVLLVKYYIFSSKYKLQRPTINGFLQLLHQTREIEEHIAFSKGKLEVHRKKWQLLQITWAVICIVFLMQNNNFTDKINVENLSFIKNINMNLICLRDLKLSLYELLDIWPDSEHLKKFNVQK